MILSLRGSGIFAVTPSALFVGKLIKVFSMDDVTTGRLARRPKVTDSVAIVLDSNSARYLFLKKINYTGVQYVCRHDFMHIYLSA